MSYAILDTKSNNIVHGPVDTEAQAESFRERLIVNSAHTEDRRGTLVVVKLAGK